VGGVVLVEFLRKVEFLEGGAEGIERPEPEDFEHIYHLYGRRVYSLCLRMAGNIAEAEGLTQQSYTFRGESSFYTWLHRLMSCNTLLLTMVSLHRL
jgi:RNA polymerase sigma-70 factor (ECF subfamily)